MKQAQLKTMMITLFLLIVGIVSVYALTVTLNYPTSEWVTSSNSVNLNFTPSGRLTTYLWCAIYTNRTDNWSVTANYTNVANGTPHVQGIAFADSSSVSRYVWNAYCYNGSEIVFDSSNNTFGVDATTPSITLDSPAYGAYQSSTTVLLRYTPTDTSNLAACDLYHNISGTWNLNTTNSSVDTGVQDGVNFTSQADGDYIWNVWCNDSAANSAWAGNNFTFTVDSTIPTDIKFTSPLNNTISSNSTPKISWNKTTEINFQYYRVRVSPYINMSNVIQTEDITTITSNSTVLSALVANRRSFIQVEAFDLAGNSVNTTTILEYVVDTRVLTVTLNTPSNGSYLKDNTPDFNVTVIDDNPDSCILYLTNASVNFSLSNDSYVGIVINMTTSAVTNGTIQNLTPSTMVDGTYKYNIGCNDTAGNFVNVSDRLLDLTIDTVSPTPPNITILWGKTNNTDKTPSLTWFSSVELNFERYLAQAFYVTNGTIRYSINITNQSLNKTNMDLTQDYTYNFSVITYDLAGNTAKSINTTDSWYYVDPVCGTLTTGWSMCGAVWTTSRNLSQIGGETSANFVSVWNATNHVWATCNYAVNPGGANCNLNVSIKNTFNSSDGSLTGGFGTSHVVWIYVNESKEWRNRTWVATSKSANITLSNYGNGWNNIAGFFRNGRTFGAMGDNFGQDNVTMFSMPYFENSTSVPYVNIGNSTMGFQTINNQTLLDYGRAMWVYYNASITTNKTYDVGSW